jgi:hypothetical protein
MPIMNVINKGLAESPLPSLHAGQFHVFQAKKTSCRVKMQKISMGIVKNGISLLKLRSVC